MNLFVLRTWLEAKFAKDERGASMVEYILLVALIALAVIAAVVFLKDQAALCDGETLTRLMEVLTDAEGRLRDAASKKIFIEVALLKAIQARKAATRARRAAARSSEVEGSAAGSVCARANSSTIGMGCDLLLRRGTD